MFPTIHNACVVVLQRLSAPSIIAGSTRGYVVGICLNWVQEVTLGHCSAELVPSIAGISCWCVPSRDSLQGVVSGALVRYDLHGDTRSLFRRTDGPTGWILPPLLGISYSYRGAECTFEKN